MLPAAVIGNGESVVLLLNGVVYTESSAALKVAVLMGLPWSLAGVFYIVPPFLRNLVYRFVARNRYRWLGKRSTCRLPTVEERTRFLE